jgi:hypothetical protein
VPSETSADSRLGEGRAPEEVESALNAHGGKGRRPEVLSRFARQAPSPTRSVPSRQRVGTSPGIWKPMSALKRTGLADA